MDYQGIKLLILSSLEAIWEKNKKSLFSRLEERLYGIYVLTIEIFLFALTKSKIISVKTIVIITIALFFTNIYYVVFGKGGE